MFIYIPLEQEQGCKILHMDKLPDWVTQELALEQCRVIKLECNYKINVEEVDPMDGESLVDIPNVYE